MPDNLLDRISDRDTLELHYAQVRRRESELLARLFPLTGGDVLSVGAGWDVGRHLFPAPAWRLTVADVDLNVVNHATETGQADEALRRTRGRAALRAGLPFDVVLYRLVLHHVAYSQPLRPGRRRGRAPAPAGRRAGGGRAGALPPGRAGARAGEPSGCGEADPRHGRRPAAFAAEAAQLRAPGGARAADPRGHVRVAPAPASGPARHLCSRWTRLRPAPEGTRPQISCF